MKAHKVKGIWIQSMNDRSEVWRNIQLIGPDSDHHRREATAVAMRWQYHAMDHKGNFSNWRFRVVAF